MTPVAASAAHRRRTMLQEASRSGDAVRHEDRTEAGVGLTSELVEVRDVLLDELLGPGAVVLPPVELHHDRVGPAELRQADHPLGGRARRRALREGAHERAVDGVEREVLHEVGVVGLLVDVDEGHQRHHVGRDGREVDDDHLVLVVDALAAVDAVTLVLHGARGVADLLLAVPGVVVDEAVALGDEEAGLGPRLRRVGVDRQHRRDDVDVDLHALDLQRVPAGADDATRLLRQVAQVELPALRGFGADLGELVGAQRQFRH